MNYLEQFNKFCSDKDMSVAVAAIRTLALVLENTKANTLTELHNQLTEVIDQISNTDASVASVKSGCELFMRFITLSNLDMDMKECLKILKERANIFIEKVNSCRKKIARSALPLFKEDGLRILLHSRSRVVLEALRTALDEGRLFTCYVTTCHTDNSGVEMARDLKRHGISCTVIADTAIAYIMNDIDLVIVGAEAVVESGGIINRLGTCTLAVVAKSCKKPVYVLAESFKFYRIFPLNQRHVPDEFKYSATVREKCQGDYSKEHPLVDYTSPQYITLLISDLGVLPTSAVSDELIRLYL